MSQKVKYTLEYVFQSSAQLLFQYLSSPSGLSEWFADNVNSRDKTFTFIWDGSEEEAVLLSKKTDSLIRFQWKEDEGEESFFEFRIEKDEITKDLSLLITDYAYDDELEEGKMLWDNQITTLKQIIGSVS